MRLENRTILITGSNRGIGKALISALLQQKVTKIYAAARNPDSLPDFNDNRVVALKLDITDSAHIQHAVQAASNLDMLINNAGSISSASAFDSPMEAVRKEMEVNYFAKLDMMRAFLPILKSAKDAAIVNIDSIAAFVNFPFLGAYSASKAASYSLSQGARIEFSQYGITVHSVNPGPIDTDMTAGADGEKTSPEETAAGIIAGLKNDEPDIFPDPIGKNMFNLWKEDYRKLEALASDWYYGSR